MNDRDKEKKFAGSVKAVLDRSLEDLDGSVQVRLREARRKALESTPKGIPAFLWAGGFATASVLVLVTGLWLFQPASSPVMSLEDVEVLAAAEDPEFYDELDFYHWLAETDRSG